MITFLAIIYIATAGMVARNALRAGVATALYAGLLWLPLVLAALTFVAVDAARARLVGDTALPSVKDTR